MATYQTAYSAGWAKGLHGQIANEEKCNKISRSVSNAGGIYFGAPAYRVAGAANDHLAAATGTLFLGIAVLNPAVPPVAAGTTLVDGYPQYFTGAFMTDGQMYVTAGGVVAAGGEVFYNTVTRRYVAAAGANIVGPLPRALYDTTSVADGDIVEISINHRGA